MQIRFRRKLCTLGHAKSSLLNKRSEYHSEGIKTKIVLCYLPLVPVKTYHSFSAILN